MKSVVFESTGEPDTVLNVKDLPEPEPEFGQIKVRMLCCPVNPSDLMFVRGQYTLSADLPATPGFEGVGIVELAGGGLRAKMMLGKRVAVLSRRGGNWAEKNVVSASQVIPFSNLLTGRLSQEQQATFFVNPVTAHVMEPPMVRQRVFRRPAYGRAFPEHAPLQNLSHRRHSRPRNESWCNQLMLRLLLRRPHETD